MAALARWLSEQRHHLPGQYKYEQVSGINAAAAERVSNLSVVQVESEPKPQVSLKSAESLNIFIVQVCCCKFPTI